MSVNLNISKTALTGCFFIYLLLLINSSVYAQHGYTPGFIIKSSGDTVQGFIKQQNSKKLTLHCLFKTDKSSKSRAFTPAELQGFRFLNSKYYVTKEYKTEKETRLVFMEYVIKGKANIYYFRDTGGDHYMIEKEGEKMIELTEPQKYIQKQGYGTVKVQPKYKGKLISELQDCNSVQPLILESKLNNVSLTQVAKQYHDCVCTTESCVIYEKEKLKPIIRYTIMGGYMTTRYNFGNELATNFGPGFQIGVAVNFRNILFSDSRIGFTSGIFFERDFSYTLSKYDKENMDAKNVTYEGEQYAIDNENTLLTVTQLDVALNVKALKVR